MKSFGKSCSVAYDSDLVVSSTDCHWGKVKIGAHMKIADGSHFYKVVNITPAAGNVLIYDFTANNRNTLFIKKNVFPYIFDGDEIKISYKEYELDKVDLIMGGGSGYKAGDFLYVEGGNTSEDFHQSSTLKVEEVDEHGHITKIAIDNNGRYVDIPKEINDVSTNGFGRHAQIKLIFKEVPRRGWISRTISLANYVNNESIITLASPIPLGVKQGKLSVEKWQIILDTPYKEKNWNQKNQPYDILNDLTPHYDMPLLIRGHISPEVIINNFMLKMSDTLGKHEKQEKEQEQYIHLLEERIKKLEDNINDIRLFGFVK